MDKQTTGYQLAVTLPDKATEASLKDFYGSVLNGGAVNDQKSFDFGNETDGWYYAGSCWMYGMALAAGTPAAGPLSAHPYDARQRLPRAPGAYPQHAGRPGAGPFRLQPGGRSGWTTICTPSSAPHVSAPQRRPGFVRQNLPALERMLAYFIQRRNDRGLFKLDDAGRHWYYDAIPTSGVNGYYNAFFYKAACDLAEMEAAAGVERRRPRSIEALAAVDQDGVQRVLWKENAPGGPRYLDWIDAKGKEVAYFCDLCQWPPVAVGIASPEQARKIVATADARIAQLEKEYGYQGFAGLSALWPVPDDVNSGQAGRRSGRT